MKKKIEHVPFIKANIIFLIKKNNFDTHLHFHNKFKIFYMYMLHFATSSPS